MEKAQQPQDDFGTFLSSVNRAMKQEKNGSSQISIRIVRYLAHTHEARIESIMMQVRAPFNEFSDGLRELSEAGLIRVDDEDDGSVIELTDEGMRWAKTMVTIDDEGEDL
jgi:predicted transcriptional regulator